MKIRFPKFEFRQEYFLLLLPLFFVVHGYNEHFGLVPFDDILSLFLYYFLFSIIITLVSGLFLRSWRKGALFAFGLLLFQIFFGAAHDGIKSIAGGSFISRYSFLLPLTLVLLTALFIYLKKSGSSFNRFTRYINILLIILIAVDLIPLLVKASGSGEINHARIPEGFIKCDTCSKPDIYFIVADEYAGYEELKDVLQYDNSAFETALEQRGFKVIDSTVSNYNYTPFCMASTFAMDYLAGIEGRNQSPSDRRICFGQINENKLFSYLKADDYSIINYSVFQADGSLPPVKSTSFFRTGKDLLNAHTFLGRLDRDIRFNTVTKLKWTAEMKNLANYELTGIQSLLALTKDAVTQESVRPRFIYTHLMMPHYPYFFDRLGKPYPVEMLMEGNQWREKNYIEYLQYSNTVFLQLIDHILENSKRPPVIIFMGDHGFRHFNRKVDQKYHFMNLNAVYLPNKDYSGFYPGMSSVNEFRVLMNTLFQQQLPLLKDSTSFLSE